MSNTISNDIHEVANLLGIEAARKLIIDEVTKVIETQGINIDLRHIMLIADMMCTSGAVKGITRYGVVSEKSSVLARASFETPIRHIINASLRGEERARPTLPHADTRPFPKTRMLPERNEPAHRQPTKTTKR